MKKLLSLCFIYFIFAAANPAFAQGPLSARYTALAIQGDLRQARALLEAPEADATATGRELQDRFHKRFIARTELLSPESGNDFIDEVVTLYRQYWTKALVGKQEPDTDQPAPEPALRNTLRAHGWTDDGTAVTPSDTYAALENALRAQGVHALTGPAPPLQDLLVWRQQSEAEFEVTLSDQERTVTVVFMNGFLSLGWKHYASLGLASTTGWADGGLLYCVDWMYEPGTESFEVSYLKHESRHLADLERFPDLPSADLEYRAKLTELIFARATQRRLLDDFTAKRAPNPGSPHAQANFRVTNDLWRELHDSPFPAGDQAWMSISRDKISRAARRLLAEDTARLNALAPSQPVTP